MLSVRIRMTIMTHQVLYNIMDVFICHMFIQVFLTGIFLTDSKRNTVNKLLFLYVSPLYNSDLFDLPSNISFRTFKCIIHSCLSCLAQCKTRNTTKLVCV